MRAAKRSAETPPDPTQFNSLFGEILDWMLAPLLFLWPISIAVIYNVANNIANLPYDQALAEDVHAIVRQVKIGNDGAIKSLPERGRDLLRYDLVDTIYFQIRGQRGERLTGDAEIPDFSAPKDVRGDTVYFRDTKVNGDEVRVAYQYLRGSNTEAPPAVMVQVAETLGKRANLANRIVAGVLLPQFAIIPLAVILVYLGLGRGIAPLNRLQRLIERRRPSDLSPIATRGMPEEVLPLLVAFNAMMERLEQNLQAQQRFIADAAHQMRTPLTGLKMQTELALQDADPEQVHASLIRISSSADRAAHLISQLLALARAEASFEKSTQAEVMDLEGLLRDVSQHFVPQAMAKHIDFGIELTGNPLLIEGNRVQLQEMIKNLIDNAIKYTLDGGKVTARTIGSAFAILEVEDSGIGIADDERELVFERFYRTLGSGVEGSGLGLAIVREIAELHRASVQLKAAASGGTLAVVTFPRRLPAAPPQPPGDAFPLA